MHWVEGLTGLEDPVGDMDELAHHGADDEHRGLASGGQALTEALTPGGARSTSEELTRAPPLALPGLDQPLLLGIEHERHAPETWSFS